jgi:hypothetical protein
MACVSVGVDAKDRQQSEVGKDRCRIPVATGAVFRVQLGRNLTELPAIVRWDNKG